MTIGAPRSRGARALGLAVALVAAAPVAGALAAALVPAVARADEAWKDEFADVCSKTQDAMTLSEAELRSLVERCDKLKPAIEQLDEPLRKVYSRRLKACRDLYQFMLDSRAPGAAR